MNFPKFPAHFLAPLLMISVSIIAAAKSFGNEYQHSDSFVHSIIVSNNFKLLLTDTENKWLKDNPVIQLGIDRAFPPFGSINKDHQYVGFSADIMRMIQHRLGFKFDIKKDVPWNETMEMAKAGKIDMISALGTLKNVRNS